MNIQKIFKAFSERDYTALAIALAEFRRFTVNKARVIGPGPTALELRGESNELIRIINYIEGKLINTPEQLVAFLTGYSGAYIGYFDIIAGEEKISKAELKAF